MCYHYTILESEVNRMKHYDLIVAGRCLSATHEAQAAVRVMPICACMGDAVGTAITVAKKTGTNTHTLDVQKVRARLIANGAEL